GRWWLRRRLGGVPGHRLGRRVRPQVLQPGDDVGEGGVDLCRAGVERRAGARTNRRGRAGRGRFLGGRARLRPVLGGVAAGVLGQEAAQTLPGSLRVLPVYEQPVLGGTGQGGVTGHRVDVDRRLHIGRDALGREKIEDIL